MSKRIVLVKNTGNSGGSWLMRIWTMHKEILMLTELAHVLKLTYSPKKNYPKIDIDYNRAVGQHIRDEYKFENSTCYDVARGFLLYQYKKRKEEVIGIIKCFDTKTVDKCKEICGNVKVIQTLRNPIGIVDVYTKRKMVIRRDNPIEDEVFKETVKQFHNSFFSAVESSIPIIRLEDLNVSLRDRTPYFREIMRKYFEVNYDDELIKRIIKIEHIGDDGSESKVVWKSWENWKKDYFLNFFEEIVKTLNYSWIIDR